MMAHHVWTVSNREIGSTLRQMKTGAGATCPGLLTASIISLRPSAALDPRRILAPPLSLPTVRTNLIPKRPIFFKMFHIFTSHLLKITSSYNLPLITCKGWFYFYYITKDEVQYGRSCLPFQKRNFTDKGFPKGSFFNIFIFIPRNL